MTTCSQRADTWLQVRTYGTWYTYCAPAWTRDEAATICEALGFTQLTNWTAEHSPEVSMMIMTTLQYSMIIVPGNVSESGDIFILYSRLLHSVFRMRLKVFVQFSF